MKFSREYVLIDTTGPGGSEVLAYFNTKEDCFEYIAVLRKQYNYQYRTLKVYQMVATSD